MNLDDEETREIPIQSMAALVFGAPRPRRVRLPGRLIFLVAVLGASAGCATGRAPTADAPETVGQLAQGPSVWHAPTHPTTDFGHAEIVSTDEEAPSTVAADAGGDAELPDIAAKDQGMKTGEVR